jgi:signal transduction histidine kinase/ligand-binding sensor domain-containing protein
MPVLLLIIFCSIPASAHNGRLALAEPLTGIVVDGDLSDWPQSIASYPVDLSLSVRPDGPADLSASFRTGYVAAEGALYVAVTVVDDAIVDSVAMASGWQDWDLEDTCEIYLETSHSAEGSWIFVVYGRDPKVFLQGRQVELAAVEVAFQHAGTTRLYEWRVDIRALGVRELAPGTLLSLDVAVGDRDSDQSFSWITWGPGVAKDGASQRRGDVLLVGDPSQHAGLTGRLAWEDTEQGVARTSIDVYPASDTLTAPLLLATDADGQFASQLPAGKYLLRPTNVVAPLQDVELTAAGETRLAVQRPLPLGRVLAAGAGRAVQAGQGRRHGSWFTLGVADGLGSNCVLSLLQDNEGDLWVGTRGGGVSRFDGGEVVTYSTVDGLAGDTVQSILQDRDGVLWFGTDRGLCRYDGDTFHTYTTVDGLSADRVLSMLEDDDGHLWLGTEDGGVSRFDGRLFTTFSVDDGLSGSSIHTILAGPGSGLWFAAQHGGVSRFEKGRFFRTRMAELVQSPALALAQGGGDRIWMATRDGLREYDETSMVADDGGQVGSAATLPRSLLHDDQGVLWIGTEADGVIRHEGQRFEHLDLDGGAVHVILEDVEGARWFGTERFGLSRYDGDIVTTYVRGEELPNATPTRLYEDRHGSMWVGTDGGLNRLDASGLTTFGPDDGIGHVGIADIVADDHGDLWIATRVGIVRYDGETFSSPISLGSPPRSLGIDGEGRILAGTWYDGIWRFDGERFEPIPTGDDYLTHVIVSDLHEDRQGQLWVAVGGDANDTGWLGRLENGVLQPLMPPRTHSSVLALAKTGDEIWFATLRDGLGRYDGRDVTHFTTRDGLAHNSVTAIQQDRRGHLWIGTAGGVSYYDGRLFHRLSTRDGLADDEVQDLLVDRRDNVWVATQTGVTRYRPTMNPPPVVITDVVADRRYGRRKTVSLSSTQDHLSFEFRGKSLVTRPEQMSFLYRLRGYDDNWSETGNRHVEYEDLPQGDYQFEVKAVDRDLNYSATPATVAVRIHPPYDWIAWVLVTAVGTCLLLWQTLRIVRRDSSLRTANRELEDTNRSLQQAQSQLVQAEKMTTLGVLAGGVAHEINNPMQAILSNARRILRFPQDEVRHAESARLVERAALHCSTIVENLLRYTRRGGDQPRGPVRLDSVVESTIALLQHQLDEDDIELHLECGDPPPFQGDFNELCTVVTNLVINGRDAILAIGGSVPGQWIRISTRAAGGAVVLEVEDSGPGVGAAVLGQVFDPFFTTKGVGQGTGLGLSITRTIVEQHGGTIALSPPKPGAGATLFTVRLPLG